MLVERLVGKLAQRHPGLTGAEGAEQRPQGRLVAQGDEHGEAALPTEKIGGFEPVHDGEGHLGLAEKAVFDEQIGHLPQEHGIFDLGEVDRDDERLGKIDPLAPMIDEDPAELILGGRSRIFLGEETELLLGLGCGARI